MNVLRSFLALTGVGLAMFAYGSDSYADTVVMKDTERVKGVVVEDYNDRIILSTMEGEKAIMRKDIDQVIYDLEEQNITSIADFYLDKNMYKEAYYYYAKALEINPDYKKAKDGLDFAGVHVQQIGRSRKLRYIQMRNEEKKWRKKLPEEEVKTEEEQVKIRLGMAIEEVEGSFKVKDVIFRSPAAKAGLKKNDIIVTVWGRNVAYMSIKEVAAKLLSPGMLDVALTVSRALTLDLRDASGSHIEILGAQLGFSSMEGLIVEKVIPDGVADGAGIEKGDSVIEIDGRSTRYMSLKDVIRIINSKIGGTLSVTIGKDMVVWKKLFK